MRDLHSNVALLRIKHLLRRAPISAPGPPPSVRSAEATSSMLFRAVMALIAITWTTLFSGALGAGLTYAPQKVTCPANLVRYGDNGLSPQEESYISQRKTKAAQSLATWIGKVGITDFKVSSFFANESNIPTLAIAFSGGGYRAMLNGAGVFQGTSPR